MFHLATRKYSDSDFKKEWSHYEKLGVVAELQSLFEEHEEYEVQCIEDLGIVEDSSYGHFILSVTAPFHGPKNELNLSHFALTHNDVLIAVCYDDDENEKYFIVEG